MKRERILELFKKMEDETDRELVDFIIDTMISGIKKEIDGLYQVHFQLSTEIVGNNDFHIGAMKALDNLYIKIHRK